MLSETDTANDTMREFENFLERRFDIMEPIDEVIETGGQIKDAYTPHVNKPGEILVYINHTNEFDLIKFIQSVYGVKDFSLSENEISFQYHGFKVELIRFY